MSISAPPPYSTLSGCSRLVVEIVNMAEEGTDVADAPGAHFLHHAKPLGLTRVMNASWMWTPVRLRTSSNVLASAAFMAMGFSQRDVLAGSAARAVTDVKMSAAGGRSLRVGVGRATPRTIRTTSGSRTPAPRSRLVRVARRDGDDCDHSPPASPGMTFVVAIRAAPSTPSALSQSPPEISRSRDEELISDLEQEIQEVRVHNCQISNRRSGGQEIIICQISGPPAE